MCSQSAFFTKGEKSGTGRSCLQGFLPHLRPDKVFAKLGSVKYKNKCAKGRSAKMVQASRGATTVRTYKHKEMKSPKSVAALIESQQWAIANEKPNFALGIAAMY